MHWNWTLGGKSALSSAIPRLLAGLPETFHSDWDLTEQPEVVQAIPVETSKSGGPQPAKVAKRVARALVDDLWPGGSGC